MRVYRRENTGLRVYRRVLIGLRVYMREYIGLRESGLREHIGWRESGLKEHTSLRESGLREHIGLRADQRAIRGLHTSIGLRDPSHYPWKVVQIVLKLIFEKLIMYQIGTS